MKANLYKLWWQVLVLLFGTFIGLFAEILNTPLFAHSSGTPRLTREPVGPYRLYAWSEPEPWRVGQVHLSLAVTIPNPDSNSNQTELPVTDVDITVTFTPIVKDGSNTVVDTLQTPIVVPALRQEFLNDFYYETNPTLMRAGEWLIQIAITGPQGSGSAEIAMETLPERTLNWTLIASAVGVLVVIIALIAIWSRSQQPAQPVHHPQRGAQQRQGNKKQVRKKA